MMPLHHKKVIRIAAAYKRLPALHQWVTIHQNEIPDATERLKEIEALLPKKSKTMKRRGKETSS